MTSEEAKLADYKKRLLDLSMRNNMLNYRDKKTGTIHVLVPDMATTYRRIVINERPMSFKGSSPGEESESDEPVRGDTTILTERTKADLDRCLRRLDTVARSSIEEQGINILYLAFGMLRWIDDTDKDHVAPLVMVPVRLTRASARSSYVLQVGDDDPVVNPTLSYFLEQNHGLVLPAFEKESPLQKYLLSVADLVKLRKGWAVSSDVVLSTFQFQKLSMYHDLETRSNEILVHPIVRTIMGDQSALKSVYEPENPDELSPMETYQVLDADSSQQTAIIAAHRGESFVLQGPPGTGKSQTITNIIADCLGSGKKVLFVSEKKAALDVVHRRLTQSNLDDFCLVLHSNKAGKKEVLAQLHKTLNLHGTKPRMSATAKTRLETMVRLRNELNLYARDIYSIVKPLGRSPYEVIGQVARYERDGVPWISCHIDGLGEITPAEVSEMTDGIRSLARELGRMGEMPEKNPWTTFGVTNLEYGESDEVIRSFTRVMKGSRELMALWKRETEKLNLDVSPTFDAMVASQDLLDNLAAMPVVPLRVTQLEPEEAKALLEQWRERQSSISSAGRQIVESLRKLAQLDPELDIHVDESAFSEAGYAQSLYTELEQRLFSTPHYRIWQRTPKSDIDAAVSKLFSCVKTYELHRDDILADYHPEVLDIDFIEMEGRFKTEYKSFFKRVFGQHGDDIRRLTSLRRSNEQVDDDEAQRVLVLIHDLSNEARSLDNQAEAFADILGDCYKGLHTDFGLIVRKRKALEAAKDCLHGLKEFEWLAANAAVENEKLSAVFDGIYNSNDAVWVDRALEAIDSYSALAGRYEGRAGGVGLGSVSELLGNSETSRTAASLAGDVRSSMSSCETAFSEVSERTSGIDLGRRSLDLLADGIETAIVAGAPSLDRSVSYNIAKRRCEELGLSSFLDALLRDKRALDQEFLEQYDLIFRHTLYRQWLGRIVWRERPSVRDFSAQEHERRIARFTELDAEQLGIDQVRILTELFPRIPSPNVRMRGGDEISILLRELKKKTRIRPIRKLFADIPHAVLALKPCLMMSPLSVSTYLESATFQFDTVIFDEASQVRTEDALGVISRGKQVIIAGDSKQLPPTNFFAATTADDDSDEDDESYYEQAGSFDSVLDEAALLNPISLKWHYRSQDESLITFSNQQIYDGDLFTFPSNRTSGRDSGVEYVYVANGIYEGSRKGNTVEAKRVADLVVAHFKTWGNERSLGVIALGESQARVIENELLDRRINDPDIERFFDTGVDEPFFVKNLENVQGDERDTIILSIGYAKGLSGRLSHNFGPINMEGGERRLNVAVTRARTNLKLVTSLDPSEIDSGRVSNIGPRLLRDYLAYAKAGTNTVGSSLVREYGYIDEDEFAGVVRDALQEAGYDVEEHVGRSGCKIDLAVRHPEHKDCFCIGVVCDGDAYHAATTARDRDRLRTQVLHVMGWNLYHVWAREWLANADGQRDQLLAAVKESIESFVPPVEREVADASDSLESDKVESDASTATIEASVEEGETKKIVAKKPEPEMVQGVLDLDFLEVDRQVEEHRYGFQNFPDYNPPRRAKIANLDILKQLIYAQAPFSVDYFTRRYIEYCCPSGRRMNETIRQTCRNLLNKDLRDTVKVRREHDTDYVFRLDQRVILPRVAGGRNIVDISMSELREGVMAVLRNYMGELDRKGLIDETVAAFEFSRRGRVIEQKIGEAIDDLRVYGRVKVVDGMYVPMGR